MNMRKFAVPLGVCLLFAGCRAHPMIDRFEADYRREYRELEDRYYAMEYQYELLAAELAAYQQTRAAPDDGKEKGVGTGFRFVPPTGPARKPDAPPAAGESEDQTAPPAHTPNIDIDLGVPAGPGAELPGPETPEQSGDDEPGNGAAGADEVDEVDAHVARIVLNHRLTGGCNFNGVPGDDGVRVVVEPRNAAGQYVALAGPVSVVVLDGSKSGPQARVARWDFDAAETAKLLFTTQHGRGIHLELPWPHEPPEHAALNVFVRYVTVDGRKLEAKREIAVDLPGRVSERWTPASSSTRQAQAEDAAPGTAGVSTSLERAAVPGPPEPWVSSPAATEQAKPIEPPQEQSVLVHSQDDSSPHR